MPIPNAGGSAIVEVVDAVPEQIGPYRIERLLGAGGAARVYVGVGPDGAKVAVKLMLGFSTESEAVSRARFALESDIRIRHPHVVRTLATGDHEGRPFLVQELLEGETLAKRLRTRGSMTPREVGQLLVEVGSGLHAMHQAGYAHRDIKLGNLFVSPGGHASIIDLGAALRLDHEGERLTAVTQVIGTPSYIAPELVRSDHALPQSDLWSLGIVAYHALTGVSPFRRESPLATMTAILFDAVQPIWELAPHVDRGLGEVIHRLLRKDPVERHASGESLAVVVRGLGPLSAERPKVLSGEEPLTSLATMAESAALSSGERRLVVVLVATGVGDPRTAARAVEQRGGRPYRLIGGRLLGLFGGTTWNGDEPYRAAFAGLELRPFAEQVGVAVGTADIGTAAPSGESVVLAENAAKSGAQGDRPRPLRPRLHRRAPRSRRRRGSFRSREPGAPDRAPSGPRRPRRPQRRAHPLCRGHRRSRLRR